MEFTQIIGLIAGICTSSSVIPQLIKTFKEKKAAEVSALMFLILIAGNSMWVYYGFAKSDIPIIATNIFSVLLNVTMLACKWIYKKG